MKNIFKCAMIIIGTLIGAGFASGKEIASFFNTFEEKGIVGIIIASLLFGSVVYVIMNLSKDYSNNYPNNKIVTLVVKVFTFVCFCIMISAIGTYGSEQFNINFWIGTLLASGTCFILFLLKFKGLEKLNNFLVPIILAGIVLVSLTSHVSNEFVPHTNNSGTGILLANWLLSSILYVGYNSILLIPILMQLDAYKLKRKEVLLLSIFIFLVLCLAGIMIFYNINLFYPQILSTEMPMLFVAKNTNEFIQILYNFVIMFAIFTTAFSCGYAFLTLNNEKNYFRNCVCICLLSVIISKIGFSNLINWCFPIFGYIGVAQIFNMFISSKRN